MASSKTAHLANILQNSIENLLLAEQQIQENVSQKDGTNFSLENFWKDIATIAQKLSFECTKICICFSNSPIPTAPETSSLLNAVEATVVCLASVWYRLPPSVGATLLREVQAAVVHSIQATRQLLKIIKDEDGEAIEYRYRQSTGIVWQGCDKLENCSRDNKAAVLKSLRDQNRIVSDAYSEITEMLEGDGSGWSSLGGESDEDEEEAKWTNEDKDLIGPSINLVKAAKILYKRVIAAVEKGGKCETSSQIQELDQLYQDCQQISSKVDILILELYPPLNISNMEEQSQLLAENVRGVLKTAAQTHVAGEDDQPHLEFIVKAIEHNLDRMKEKLSHRQT